MPKTKLPLFVSKTWKHFGFLQGPEAAQRIQNQMDYPYYQVGKDKISVVGKKKKILTRGTILFYDHITNFIIDE
ncbi:hypothetical protein BSNK01_21350 [Bacillaceae bacterium]